MNNIEKPKLPYEFKMQKKFAAAEIARGVDLQKEVISIDVVEAGYRQNGVMGHKIFLAVYSKDKDSDGEIKPLAALPLGGLETSVQEVDGAGPLGMLHYVQATQGEIAVAKQNRKICLLQLREAGYQTNKPKRVLSTSSYSVGEGRLSLSRALF